MKLNDEVEAVSIRSKVNFTVASYNTFLSVILLCNLGTEGEIGTIFHFRADAELATLISGVRP